jgi:putative transposase
MPRANRQYRPGYVWHITHRCHNREFLLKFERDRKRWKYWLFQARKRFGLSVLNFIATSNHVHLLIQDTGANTIAASLQLIAGRVAQEYNRRKSRKGAFWEDRYFATAVATDRHLFQCLVYIDLNMVRAGVVSHPSEWAVSGYNEIQNPPSRYRIINHAALCRLGDFADLTSLWSQHRVWIDQALAGRSGSREAKWTESRAVGPDSFVTAFQEQQQLGE